jgi:hypothetical protein
MSSQTFQRLTQAALDQHNQIYFYLDQIAGSLDNLRQGLSDVEPMRRLAAQIEGLKERLLEHQQLEEHGGLFQGVLDALPARRVEIDRLTNQHGKMIEILEMARLHAQCGEVTEADALRVDLEQFIKVFREHEQEEEDLLTQAIERDIAD